MDGTQFEWASEYRGILDSLEGKEATVTTSYSLTTVKPYSQLQINNVNVNVNVTLQDIKLQLSKQTYVPPPPTPSHHTPPIIPSPHNPLPSPICTSPVSGGTHPTSLTGHSIHPLCSSSNIAHALDSTCSAHPHSHQ